MDLYEKVKSYPQRRKAAEASRKADKRERGKSISDWIDAISTGVSTEKYRDGWDRIFGSKGRDEISDEGEGRP